MRRVFIKLSGMLVGLFLPALAWAQAQVDVAGQGVAVTRESVSMLKKILDWMVEATVKYSFQVLGGIVVLAAGWVIANFVARFVGNFLKKKKIDVTVAKYVVSITKMIIMVFALIAALSKFGIEIAPLIAGLSVVGLGASLAMQGPISNYAAGAILIFTKPFKVGDLIEVIDIAGEVEDMTLPRTILKTVDGDTIVVPNKHIIGEIIQNSSDFKRVDLTVGVAYSADIDKAIRLIKETIKKDSRVAQTREPKVGINEFGDSSVNIFIRLWCKQAEYYDVRFATNKNIFEAFKVNGIEIPFPQREVRILDGKA
jgi:small conductance mechanosensitive channel